MNVSPLPVMPNNLLRIFASHLRNLELCWFGGFSLQDGNTSTKGTRMTPFNWKVRCSPGHLGLLMPWNQEAEKRVIYRVECLILVTKRKLIGLLLENEDKKNYVWNTVNFLGHFLVCPCPIVNVKVKL